MGFSMTESNCLIVGFNQFEDKHKKLEKFLKENFNIDTSKGNSFGSLNIEFQKTPKRVVEFQRYDATINLAKVSSHGLLLYAVVFHYEDEKKDDEACAELGSVDGTIFVPFSNIVAIYEC